MSLPSAVHESSTNEFGAIRCDCLVQFSNLAFFSEPHECHCLALFMHPPRTSMEPREVISLRFSPILHSPLLFGAP